MTQNLENRTISSIDPATEVGLLSLTVADLSRSLNFYTQALGFAVLQHGTTEAVLGTADTPLLLLTQHAGASPWPRDRASYTGLYHFAILMPKRKDLGRWLHHWLELGLPLPGQGDHLVSEALYLADPDGNGIEIYRDRPREEWRWVNGQVQMATDPVDIRGLLDEAQRSNEPWTGLPVGTRLGHIHLQVGDIAQAATFYHEILGFDIVVRMPTALFVSAGGYHHHLGLNTWHSKGATAAPAGTAGLRFFTIELPSEEAMNAVRSRIEAAKLPFTHSAGRLVLQDPWQNTIVLRIGPASNAAEAAALNAVLGDPGHRV